MSYSRVLAILYADASGFTAAMAESEDRAISRLQAGQRLIRQSAAAFGGRVVDTAGDSALVVFESARAAFKAAQQIQTQTKIQSKSAEQIIPFPCRIGLTMGPVKVHGNRVYGHLVNLAARIESLVGRGNIGVEKTAWNEVQPLAHGAETRSKVLFARPEEPVVQFFEIGDRVGFDDYRTGENSRNQPVVLVVPFSDGAASPLRDSAFEAVLWECSALFNSYGWHSEIVRGSATVIELPTFSADYVIRLRITGFASGLRISASFSSRHSRHGMQNFTQESASESESAQSALAIASLVGTAIVHCETERAGVSHGIGSFQLVTAGRELISGLSPKSIARGLEFLRRAYEIDAEYPTLLSSLGRAHAIAWRFGSTEEGVDHLELARKYADKAVSLAPHDPRCRADLGFVKFWNNEVDESAWLYEHSLTALPFHPELTADAGMVFSFVGRNDEAAVILERSVTNLPSSADYRLWSLGDVYFSKHDYRNSLRWLGRMSDQSQAQRLLAASKARLGLDPSPHVSAVLSQQPDFSVSRWVSIQPFANEEDRVDFEQALLLAGLPP